MNYEAVRTIKVPGGWLRIVFVPEGRCEDARGESGGDDSLRLAQNLKLMLEANGISMRMVSRKTEIPEATLSGYVNGAEPSKMAHIRALAHFFDLTMENLLYGFPASEGKPKG